MRPRSNPGLLRSDFSIVRCNGNSSSTRMKVEDSKREISPVFGHVTHLPKFPDFGIWFEASRITFKDGMRIFDYSGSAPIDKNGNFRLGGLRAGDYVFRVDVPASAEESVK